MGFHMFLVNHFIEISGIEANSERTEAFDWTYEEI